MPAGIGHGERIRAAVDHRAFHGPAARAIAARQGPRVEVATLKPITEVYRWSYSGSAERHRLRAICRVIGEGQAGAACSVSTRGEGHIDRAGASRRQRTAATGAGVGLREVDAFVPVNAMLLILNGVVPLLVSVTACAALAVAHVLVAKAHTCRAQAHSGSR